MAAPRGKTRQHLSEYGTTEIVSASGTAVADTPAGVSMSSARAPTRRIASMPARCGPVTATTITGATDPAVTDATGAGSSRRARSSGAGDQSRGVSH